MVSLGQTLSALLVETLKGWSLPKARVMTESGLEERGLAGCLGTGEVVGLGRGRYGWVCKFIHSKEVQRLRQGCVGRSSGVPGVEGCSISEGQLWMDVGGLSGASVPVRVATLNAWLMGFNLTPSNAERRVKVSIPAPPHSSTFLCMHLLRFMYLVEKA